MGGGIVFIYSKNILWLKYISKLNLVGRQYDVEKAHKYVFVSQLLEVKEHTVLHLFDWCMYWNVRT